MAASQATQPPAGRNSDDSPRLADLVLPLATLLGLAERPGGGHGLGPLDPALCRELAVAAAGSPDSRLCVTVTDSDGIAIGHGCARAARRGKRPAGADHGSPAEHVRPGPAHGAVALPARVNLTITADRLTELARTTGPPGRASWAFTRDTDPGPPDGYGSWTLTLPDGRNLVVELQPVPTFECDHRFESHAYQPNDTLRHLVQIRDGDCTFPPCSRHARESDFEHAIPFDKGGRTCACNAGARSRSLPPGQAVAGLERHSAKTRLAPVDNAEWSHLYSRPEAIPGLAAGTQVSGGGAGRAASACGAGAVA